FNAVCYKNWLQSPGSTGTGEEGKDFGYSILPSPGNSNTYILVADKDAAHRSWILSPESANFGLDFLGNMADAGFAEFYYPSGSVNGSSDYFRKITITLDPTPPYNHPASAPFNTDIGPKVKVKSQVWWVDNRRCLRGPDRVDYPANGQCAVTLETYLTNWKNY
ncbi:MAG: hypothetical protein M1383_01725, partial [Patescibacteria group bacterium]|nr:hypothetical protein [Patescibacteria group bacterium]